MGYAPQRSMSGNLQEGATDGTYKKIIRERGGFVENTTWEARKDLADVWYGMYEAPVKTNSSGQEVVTPNTVKTRRSAFPWF